MSPVDGAGASNPNLPVDRAVTVGREPTTNPEQIPELAEVDCPAGTLKPSVTSLKWWISASID